MTTINLGKVRITDKGVWVPDYAGGYGILDVVTFEKGSYMSKVSANSAALTDRASWVPFVDTASIEEAIQEANEAAGLADQARLAIEGSLAKLELADAEHSSQIRDIENVISTMNPNQSAQLSVSGRKTVSLPKNASNGGMQVKLEGLTAENLVVNGDFRNGLTGWSLYTGGAALAIEGDYLTYISNAQAQAIAQTGKSFATGDKLYVYAIMKVDETSTGMTAGVAFVAIGTSLLPSVTVGVTDTVVRGIITTASNLTSIVFGRADTVNKKVYLKKGARVVNLTATFGAGNEPTVEECDAIFGEYFEGVKSFEPTGRVRSVGKNLWIEPREKKLFDSYVSSSVSIVDLGESIKIMGPGSLTKKIYIPKGTYKLVVDGYMDSGALGIVGVYFMGGSAIGYLSVASTRGVKTSTDITVPESGWYDIRYYPSNTGSTGFNMYIYSAMLIRADASASYEPYKETSLYLTAPELRSNGAVKDEIRKGANGYELVKRVGVGTLGSELVTNGGFDTDTWWTKGADWSIANGVASKSNPASTADLLSPSIITANTWYVVTFEVKNYVSGVIYSVFTGSAYTTSPFANSNGIKTYLIFSASASSTMAIRGQSFVGSVDNISIKKLTIQDDAPLNLSIPRVYTGMANYTLAETRIIPISYGGILNSAENGTLYHESVIADAGVYGTNMPILMQDYPIATIEEIIKHENGVDTYLNAATAVIAGDKLSFTHPSLQSGDLVLFTYAFAKESTNGNITATFYDSNVVKIDTVTGKAYRINEVVTNGVLTRTLTEV